VRTGIFRAAAGCAGLDLRLSGRILRRTPADAAILIKSAKAPLIIAGGGVQYSEATAELAAFAETHNIPVVETIAGRANLLFDHRLNAGPIGVTGSNAANHLAEKADVIVAIGTRLQDFTTGSWTAFSKDAKLIGLNVGRFDAGKHMALPVVGDAKLSMTALSDALAKYSAPKSWSDLAEKQVKTWNSYIDENISPQTRDGNKRPMSYAQVIGAVNTFCHKDDRVLTAAGGMPSELAANWRTKGLGTVDIEYGFSCMGYEVAGGWGAKIAQAEDEPDRETIVLVGDGSYLILNTDIYSSVLTNKKLIVIICDNGGFAVINKLQNGTGNVSYNNLIKDSNITGEPFAVDFEMHAKSMGANAETVDSIANLNEALKRAKASPKTYVISLKVDAFDGWTKEGHTWWEVGTPHVSKSEKVMQAHKDWEAGRKRQRVGV
jgi:3D-(3,5/4)-trihydroxycyclohexane-1,2-dione acylhydrolase (decyclizing)